MLDITCAVGALLIQLILRERGCFSMAQLQPKACIDSSRLAPPSTCKRAEDKQLKRSAIKLFNLLKPFNSLLNILIVYEYMHWIHIEALNNQTMLIKSIYTMHNDMYYLSFLPLITWVHDHHHVIDTLVWPQGFGSLCKSFLL